MRRADLLELLARPLPRPLERRQLARHAIQRDRKPDDLRALNRDQRRTDGHAGRDADALQAFHDSSPNPDSTSCTSASTAACSSAPIGRDRDRRAPRRRQQQNAHDALSVHHLRVADDTDVRLEARRQVDEPRRGARVQSELVDDGDGAVIMRRRSRLLAPQQVRRHPDRVPPVLAHLPRHGQQVRLLGQLRPA